MKKNRLFIRVLIFSLIVNSSYAQTLLSGTLTCNQTLNTSGSPYRVTSDITVADGCILTVNPGVEIQMDQNTHLIIHGKANFMGTSSSPIWIHAKDTIWGNILLDNTLAQKSSFNYVTIENARKGSDVDQEPGAIYGLKSSVEVKNCRFKNNLRCISVYQCPKTLVQDCMMDSTNRGEKVHGQYCNGSIVQNCILYATRGDCDGIDFDASNKVLISNNSIYDGDDDAIDIGQCDSIGCDTVTVQFNYISNMFNKGVSNGENCQHITIHHNVISGCAMGIGAKSNAHVVADHNTLYGNTVGVSSYEHLEQIWGPGHLTVTNCIIANSDTAWKVDPTAYLAISYSLADDTVLPGSNNVTGNPFFVNPVINPSGDFHIMAGSAAIDKGNPSDPLDADGTRSDIGALYFHPTGIKQYESPHPSIVFYPNPATNNFNLTFTDNTMLEHSGAIIIKIFNSIGQEIFNDIIKTDQLLVSHEVRMNYPGRGTYFVQVTSQNSTTSQKLMIE